jgi:hypothetical protein
MKEVKEHEIMRHLTEIIITPEHAERKESEEFRRNKERLKEDGHYKCYICGSTKNLQVHHFGCEWSLEKVCDFDKLKQFCEEFDPYGYGRLLKNKPMDSVDDIRNLLVLCQEHHTGVDHADGGSGAGVHELTMPIWIIQKLAKKDEIPVPQEGQTVQEVEEEIK